MGFTLACHGAAAMGVRVGAVVVKSFVLALLLALLLWLLSRVSIGAVRSSRSFMAVALVGDEGLS